MFIGEYEHSMDAKGRVFLPAKFRGDFEEGLVMTKGLENCLFVYPMEEWRIIESKIKNLPMTDKNARKFVRTFSAGASDATMDKQGRIVIPQNLRNHASIDKEVVIIGAATRVEIWARNEWDSYNSDDEGLSYEELAERMTEMGI